MPTRLRWASGARHPDAVRPWPRSTGPFAGRADRSGGTREVSGPGHARELYGFAKAQVDALVPVPGAEGPLLLAGRPPKPRLAAGAIQAPSQSQTGEPFHTNVKDHSPGVPSVTPTDWAAA